MNSVGVRQKLIDALRLDLVGPDNGSALEREILPQSPSRWYLTGFLVPLDAPLEKRVEEGDESQMDLLPEPTGAAADDAAAPEPSPARKAVLPSSMGLSFLVPAGQGPSRSGSTGAITKRSSGRKRPGKTSREGINPSPTRGPI